MRHRRVDRGCTRYRQATAAVSRCRRNARGEASRSGRGTHGSGGRRFDEDEHERKALIHRGDCKVGSYVKGRDVRTRVRPQSLLTFDDQSPDSGGTQLPCHAMVGALVTADLDTMTIIHTHTPCIHPKNVPHRSSALARVMVFPQ